MIVKKKMPYYIFAVAVIEFIFLLSDCMIYGNETYSYIKTVFTFEKEYLAGQYVTAAHTLGMASTYWSYIIMSVAVCIPTISEFFDELNSGLHLGIQMKKGRYRYIISKCFFSYISGAVTVFIALFIFLVIISLTLPINYESAASVMESLSTDGMKELINTFLRQSVTFMLYAGAMSLTGILTVFIYADMLFDLSLVFILAYFTINPFIYRILWLPAAFTVFLFILCPLLWKYRSRLL